MTKFSPPFWTTNKGQDIATSSSPYPPDSPYCKDQARAKLARTLWSISARTGPQ